jgi:hypothetical protein
MKCRRVHHREEASDILISRPSKWGCPFSYKKLSTAPYKVANRKESIDAHKEWLLNGEGQYLLKDIHELSGKILGCWCSGKVGCHGDILVELANSYIDYDGYRYWYYYRIPRDGDIYLEICDGVCNGIHEYEDEDDIFGFTYKRYVILSKVKIDI